MPFSLSSFDEIVSSVSSQATRLLDSSSVTNGVSGTLNQVIGNVNSVANTVNNVADEVQRLGNALNNLSDPAELVSSLRSVNLPLGGNPYSYMPVGPMRGQYIQYGMNAGLGSVSWGGGSSDWRVKLGDLTFPFTPSVSISGQASWETVPLIHQNAGFEAFQFSKPETYQISAPFYVEDAAGAEYWLNARDYLRTSTKMMGAAPPPILCFKGYGGTIDAPVIIISYSVELGTDVNYIAAGGTYVPAKSQFSITLRTIYSPNSQGFY